MINLAFTMEIPNFIILLIAALLYIMAMSMKTKKSRKNAYLLEVVAIVLVAVYILPGTRFSFDSIIPSLTSILMSVLILCALVNKLFFHKK